MKYLKREGDLSFRYSKGPLTRIVRIDAPHGCSISFIMNYMEETTRLPFWGDLFIIRASYGNMYKEGVPHESSTFVKYPP